jgi:hypothetical protein
MAVEGGPDIVDSGLVLTVDAANVRSFRGVPTTNAISNADTMASWTLYYRTTAASTFTTEFGTTGYRFTNQPSWNGIYRNFNLGSAGNYTFSAWVRYNGGSSNNNGATVYVSNYGGGDTAVGVNKALIGVWQRIAITVNVTSPSNVYLYLISYGGTDNGTGNPDYSSWEVTMPQIEAGSTLTPFVNGTRGTTVATGGGWADLTGNGGNGELINGPTYSSSNGGTIVFDGSNDTISITKPNPNISGYISLCVWVKFNNYDSSPIVIHKGSHYTFQMRANVGTDYWTYADSSTYSYATFGYRQAPGLYQTNTWMYLVVTKDSSNAVRLYKNGVLLDTRTGFGSSLSQTNTTLWLSGYSDTDSAPTNNLLNGEIGIVQIYQGTLSDAQILQNFNAQRKRFGV